MSKKVAIVTGATSGIGLAVSKRLGQEGFHVVMNGIDDAKGADRVKELTAAGSSVEYHGFDVRNEEQVTSHVKAIGEKHGRIDVLVNNAGG